MIVALSHMFGGEGVGYQGNSKHNTRGTTTALRVTEANVSF
jgi:hypothetical protein